jgi:hypothetical protein
VLTVCNQHGAQLIAAEVQHLSLVDATAAVVSSCIGVPHWQSPVAADETPTGWTLVAFGTSALTV